jgi:hypothetical protein
LLIIRAVDREGNVLPMRKDQPAGPDHQTTGLTLAAGESIELHDVEWWKRLDPSFAVKNQMVEVTFQVATPGLWNLPAHSGWSISFMADRLKAAVQKSESEKSR